MEGGDMNYFPPDSFLHFSSPINNGKGRIGRFIIEPINTSSNDQLYWVFSSYDKNKNYISSVKKSDGSIHYKSPPFCSEEQSINWLEQKIIQIVEEQITIANQKLLQKIESNNRFLERIKGE